MNRVLIISDGDNVAVALEPLEAGTIVEVGGASVAISEAVPAGHKVALTSIKSGEPVIKYGSPIGLATVEIAQGQHVHVHNVASTRGRGDLTPR
jgi:altronate dehydratase